MINGDLRYFLDKLFLGEELVVGYRARRYLIQGYSFGKQHMEMFYEDGSDVGEYLWRVERPTMAECATEFLHAPLWDGRAFNEAEAEMEWIT